MACKALVLEHRTTPQVGVDVRYIVGDISQGQNYRKVDTVHIAFQQGESEVDYRARFDSELDAAIQGTITELGG